MASAIPVITELDAARIREMRKRLPAGHENVMAMCDLMALVSGEAEIVPGRRVPPDVVTVNSQVSFHDELTGCMHRVTLVFPQDVSIAERRISVLSPVGRALLGRRVGEAAGIELPDGSSREISIHRIHYQPEASGHVDR
jgi:regulator of nucleoside diphosphate kinase